ncbi:MAG TPA: HNH endonuclease [Actinomycetes bacterium]|nr:HNH endonuclease [Actinomycetes bacterium]
MTELRELFWGKVDRRSPEECWRWLSAVDKDGYGKHTLRGRTVRAHRFSYELSVGELSPGICVCHRCDNPSCVNPGHLFLGTNAENTADKVAKGRQARGESLPQAKLTAANIADIRILRTQGWTQQALADKFAVSQVQISKICRGKKWV